MAAEHTGDRALDLVDTLVLQLRHIVPGGVDDVSVVARPADHGVSPGTSIDPVVPAQPTQAIGPRQAVDDIVLRRGQRLAVGGCRCIHGIVASGAGDRHTRKVGQRDRQQLGALVGPVARRWRLDILNSSP